MDSVGELTRDGLDGPGFVTLRRRDGTVVDVEAAAVPLESDQGRHLVMLVRDVTARRQADAERERLLARAALSAEAAELLGAAADEKGTLDALVRLCVRELADTCVAVLADKPGAVRLSAVAAREPERERALLELQLRYPLDEEPHRAIEDVLRTGRGRRIEGVTEDHLRVVAVDERHFELLRTLTIGTALIVPLRSRTGVSGALAVGIAELDDADHVTGALEDVGRLGGLALDAARLADQRTTMARTLQRSLLPPSLPAIPGVDIAARHRAAGEGTEVGGDFYDAFAAGEGAWAVAIGDVCGRGAEAAAVTTLARCTLRAAVLQDRRPDAVLRALNEAVLGRGAEFRFCTALYLSVRPRDGGADVSLSSGGHPLPLVVRAGGEVEPAGRAGTLLGVVPDPELTCADVRLDPGDALVLVTDGAAPGDVAAFLRGCADRSAEAIAAAVEERAVAESGGLLRDDAAVVVLRAAV
jgi:Stage II sporulation protein E (SpoIIE)